MQSTLSIGFRNIPGDPNIGNVHDTPCGLYTVALVNVAIETCNLGSSGLLQRAP